ncbi:MAG: hypothetical protein ACFB9N_00095 [Geitlerinemataceae cyanobacterium]
MSSNFQSCKSKAHALGIDSLQLLVDEYLHHWGSSYQQEDAWWGDRTLNWEAALARAWNSRFSDGKMHAHQYRVGSKKLSEGLGIALDRQKLPDSFESFRDVYDWIEHITRDVYRIGDVTAYDVARRLGAWLGLAPSRVYLHGGTRIGAKILGVYDNPAPLSVFPHPLRALSATHIENFLCIYKARLTNEMTV